MSVVGLFLRKYWRELAALALLAFAFWRGYSWAYGNGEQDERSRWLVKENKALLAVVAERDKAIAERNAAQRKVDELAKLPPKVVEVVRANPSGCVVPGPVADAARVQVDAVNEAIRSVR